MYVRSVGLVALLVIGIVTMLSASAKQDGGIDLMSVASATSVVGGAWQGDPPGIPPYRIVPGAECSGLDNCDANNRRATGPGNCWYCEDRGIQTRWCKRAEETWCFEKTTSDCGGKIPCDWDVATQTCDWNNCNFAIEGCPKSDCFGTL
ncbi:MAG: hypothetical protein GY711_13570 [bacterium]|nr:hypothetical protein [bacterium]